ncbi:MAG TPA: orotidine-5'-phosphate decarboxylase [Pirellulales bacterium]|jgi:orotidine-5'-phosphate decarboxylase|nr:orotidine-5'-phosphate decarboxylase [Pirellulales bacterium]
MTAPEPLKSFSHRLTAAIRLRRNPVVVGLDPRWEQLPEPIIRGQNPADPADRAAAYALFCREVIDVVHSLVPAVKPQAAFFEQLGSAGMQALEMVVRHARRQGLMVIMDGKRNDIGSTAEAYADAYLGQRSAWQADALTVSPYLGLDSLEPFVTVAEERGAGVFVLVKTSNPGGGAFQDLIADGRPLYRHVAEQVERLAQRTTSRDCEGADAIGDINYGAVGAVAGATYPRQLAELRETMPHAWLLVPGYGSQGATARDVAAAFDATGLGAVVNNSRGIIFAHARKEYTEQYGADRWQGAVEAATRAMIEELRAETSVGRL